MNTPKYAISSRPAGYIKDDDFIPTIVEGKPPKFGGHVKLYRVKALRSFTLNDGATAVAEGELGGLVEKPENLSQEGSCWVGAHSAAVGNSRVEGGAAVIDGGIVYGDAVVAGETDVVRGYVGGKARLLGTGLISNGSRVDGDVLVEPGGHLGLDECSCAFGEFKVFKGGFASGRGHSEFGGYAKVRGSAFLEPNSSLFAWAEVAEGAILEGGNIHVGGHARVVKSTELQPGSYVVDGDISSNMDTFPFPVPLGDARCPYWRTATYNRLDGSFHLNDEPRAITPAKLKEKVADCPYAGLARTIIDYLANADEMGVRG